MSTTTTKNGGQFPQGTSGNPAGRPPGSRNRATLLAEQLLDGEAEQLMRKAIEMAQAGDVSALRLCLERLLPPRRECPIHVTLPPIDNVSQIADAVKTVVTSVSEGLITPSEGKVLTEILALHATVLTVPDLEARVKDLERFIKQ
jgi:hypothetical protein